MKQDFFIKNRERLSEMLQDNSIMILYAGVAPRKSADETYPFCVNKNFYYLTGVAEAGTIVVMTKINGMLQTVLFLHRPNEVMAKWVGATLTEQDAREQSGIQTILFLDEFLDFINRYLENFVVYLDLERRKFQESMTESQQFAQELKVKYPYLVIQNAHDLIAGLRMVKMPAEIEKMRHAIEITRLGIEEIYRYVSKCQYENQIESYFDQALKYHGASDFAFKSIVAAGKNACILHYEDNNQAYRDGDLLLLDLGAAYQRYHADISRTFPVNGQFTARQREIYNIVLQGQKIVMNVIRPGLTLREINQVLVDYYAIELKRIGLIQEDSEVRKYYFHSVSHHLGLDTHDVSLAKPLEIGNVITVEPGLYIEDEKIGIRIEDDVLITEQGCENLSISIPKTVEELESILQSYRDERNT